MKQALGCPDDDLSKCSVNAFFTFVSGWGRRVHSTALKLNAYFDSGLHGVGERDVAAEISSLVCRATRSMGRRLRRDYRREWLASGLKAVVGYDIFPPELVCENTMRRLGGALATTIEKGSSCYGETASFLDVGAQLEVHDKYLRSITIAELQLNAVVISWPDYDEEPTMDQLNGALEAIAAAAPMPRFEGETLLLQSPVSAQQVIAPASSSIPYPVRCGEPSGGQPHARCIVRLGTLPVATTDLCGDGHFVSWSGTNAAYAAVSARFGTFEEHRGIAVAAAVPADACTDVTAVAAGTAVVVMRGGCSFWAKALAVQAAGAAAALVVNSEDGGPVGALACPAASDCAGVHIPVLFLERDPAGEALMAALATVPPSLSLTCAGAPEAEAAKQGRAARWLAAGFASLQDQPFILSEVRAPPPPPPSLPVPPVTAQSWSRRSAEFRS